MCILEKLDVKAGAINGLRVHRLKFYGSQQLEKQTANLIFTFDGPFFKTELVYKHWNLKGLKGQKYDISLCVLILDTGCELIQVCTI